jgi:hypothetical protein
MRRKVIAIRTWTNETSKGWTFKTSAGFFSVPFSPLGAARLRMYFPQLKTLFNEVKVLHRNKLIGEWAHLRVREIVRDGTVRKELLPGD